MKNTAMMSLEIWLAFVLTSTILLLIPGPTILTVVSYSVSHGRQASVPLVLAVTLGDSTALALSLLGLGTLLATSAFWFTVLKWLGGCYLLFLGIKMLLNGVRQETLAPRAESDAGHRLFLNTYMVTALNPKGLVFFVAFLPQFVATEGNVTAQLWTLAVTFVALALINATMYVVASAKVRDVLLGGRSQTIFNLVGGSALTAAGAWTLLSQNTD